MAIIGVGVFYKVGVNKEVAQDVPMVYVPANMKVADIALLNRIINAVIAPYK